MPRGTPLKAIPRDLTDFAANLNVDLAEAGTEDIRSYMRGLSDRGMSDATAARRLSALRQFYRFLLAEDLRQDDPTRLVESPRRGRPLPKILSEAEVDALLAAAREYTGPEGRRFVALMEVLYATGLRVTELVSLPIAAARANDDLLLIRGKGGRERMVPLSPASKTGHCRLCRCPRSFCETGYRPQMAVPLAGQGRASNPATVFPIGQGIGPESQCCPWQGLAPQPAACLCLAYVGQWRRPPFGAENAWPCGHFNHPDLYPCP